MNVVNIFVREHFDKIIQLCTEDGQSNNENIRDVNCFLYNFLEIIIFLYLYALIDIVPNNYLKFFFNIDTE